MIALLFLLNEDPSMDLIRAITFHDTPERLTGDIPAPAKESFPDLREDLKECSHDIVFSWGIPYPRLTEEDDQWLKALDSLDFFLWCQDQKAMGNQNINDAETITIMWQQLHSMNLPEPVRKFLDEFKYERTSDFWQ